MSTFSTHLFTLHDYGTCDYKFINYNKTFLFLGLWVTTECGKLQVSPGEIVILPQGFRFAIDLPDGPSRGYVAEVFGTHFQLPDLGPIGN